MSGTSAKRCFVISPIGAEGSEVREHADNVYDYIIKPAMDACGIDAIRSDHLREPGRITEQMFRSLLHDDLAVAVLTGYNPNVFYELAIAQAAARPVIILIEKGQVLPFDIQDLRCVYYDFKPKPLFEKVYTNEIIAHVRQLESAGWTTPPPFGVLPPLGGSGALSDPRYYAKSESFGGVDVWLELMQATRQTLEVLGFSLGFFRAIRGLTDVLSEKARAGCRVRLLLMHPDNPVLRECINDLVTANNYETIVHDIDAMMRLLTKSAVDVPSIEVRQMRHGCPHFHLMRTDSLAVVTQNLFSTTLRYSPLWHAPAGTSLYTIAAQEFEALWMVNAG